MNKIKGFKIDTSPMRQIATARGFTITGDADARVTLQITNEDGHYYDFDTAAFSAVEKKLSQVALTGGVYEGTIIFPAVGDADKYNILLLAEPIYNTELHSGLSDNKYLYTTSIDQLIDTTVTFALTTATSGDWQTFPTSVTATGSPTLSGTVTVVDIEWIVKATDSASGGAMELIAQPTADKWVDATADSGISRSYERGSAVLTPLTAVLNGAVTATNDIILVDSFGIRGDGTVTLSGIGFDNKTPQFVIATDYATNSITVTSAQTLRDKTILTFEGTTQEATIKTTMHITRFPSADLTVNLDIDNLITINLS